MVLAKKNDRNYKNTLKKKTEKPHTHKIKIFSYLNIIMD